MKLLFDQNLSSSLVAALADLFPDSAHVRIIGMLEADDSAIWDYALAQGFAIVTKDQDYNDRAQLAERAPKIVWIRLGNCPTKQVEHLLRMQHQRIQAFGAQDIDSVLGLPIKEET